MRPTCVDCAIKHLAQASILLQESRHGYPDHIFYSRGHMAEAEAELAKLYPGHSDMIRAKRKLLEQDPDYTPDFTALMKQINQECEVCQLEPGPPHRPTSVPNRPSRGARSNPISWTKCELRYPSVQRKIEKCVLQVTGKPGVVNPYAVCRAAIKCPP